MTQRQIWRYHNSTDFSAGATAGNVKLERGLVIRKLLLRLSGGVTCAAAINVKANVNRGDEWSLLSKIEIVANSNNVLRSFSGPELWFWNFFANGCRRPQVSPLIGSGVALTNTDSDFNSVLTIPFVDPWSDKPMDTALDTTRIGDLKIVPTWNTIGRGIIGSGAGTNAVTAVTATLSVYANESDATSGPYATSSGNFIPTTMKPNRFTIGAAATDFRCEIPTGPAVRGFLINASTTANGMQTDEPLKVTNIKIIRNDETILDLPWSVAWQLGILEAGGGPGDFFDPALTPPAAVTNGGYGPGNTVTAAADQGQYGFPGNSELGDIRAWVWIDIANDGYLSEAIGTAGAGTFEIRLNTNAAVDVAIWPVCLFPAG